MTEPEAPKNQTPAEPPAADPKPTESAAKPPVEPPAEPTKTPKEADPKPTEPTKTSKEADPKQPAQTESDRKQADFEARLAKAEETIQQAQAERDQAKRDQLILANDVPEELIDLLPADPAALEAYLKTDKYKALKTKIKAATKPQEPNDADPKGKRPPGDKAPAKGEKRVFGKLDRSELSDLGALIVGNS